MVTVLAASAAQAGVVLDAPGHVFTEQEAVTASGGTPGTAWMVTDWLGRPGTNGVWDAAGKAAFGRLPAGYYHLAGVGFDATFAVVPPVSERTFDHGSFYGVDSAQSWVSRKGGFLCPWQGGDTFRVVSDLIQKTGLPHVRDRLSAGEVNPKPGSYDFRHYMYNADLLRDRGILLSGMFHDVPAHMDRIQKLPRDLGALFAFCRDTAAAFGDRMGDWEFWNEQDISFAPEPAWDYAAALKAAYLGFKAAHPGKTVLDGALCHAGRTAYDHALFANDAGKYMDVFNFHTYSPLHDYPRIFAELRAFMKEYGMADRAVWMTESGTNLEGHSEKDGAIAGQKAHSPDQELVHAECYAKSQVLFQMEGVARDYFFVFGAYNERNGAKDWGVMRRDGTVKPTYAAMSAITRALVSARLAGEVKVGDGLRAFLFDQPDGTQTLAFWSVSPADTASGNVKARPACAKAFARTATAGTYVLDDMCGRRTAVACDGTAPLKLEATRFPAYLSGLRGLKADVAPFPRGAVKPYAPAADEDLSVVLRVDLDPADFGIAGQKSLAELRGDTGRLRLHVWNLAPAAKRGSVEVAGGSLAGLPAEIDLPPMGEAAFDCVYTPPAGGKFLDRLVLAGRFAGKRSSRLVVPVRLERAFLASCEKTELLHWRDPKAWARNTSADECKAAWDEAEQAVRFDFAWNKPADRWFYPVYALDRPAEDLSDALMLEFEVKSAQDKVENDFACQNLMLVFEDGRSTFIPYPAPLGAWEKRRVQIAADDKGPGPVKAFRLGANPNGTRCTFWLRSLRILKTKK